MYGAFTGDIAGSRFEFHNRRSKDFTIFDKSCYFTDDSVMTIAVGKALSESKKNGYKDLDEQLDKWMHEIGKKYPHCGYGGHFYEWVMEDLHEPYQSYGNGAGMRTSACGEIAETLEEALFLAEKCAAITHDHPEGIRGAQAITACIFLAREGKMMQEIRQYVEDNFYDLSFTIDEIRPFYRFNETCQDSCPQAIEAFLESVDFEDAIRNAISLGGDSDTIAAMTGAIAEAYYGIPEEFITSARSYFDSYLLDIIDSIDLK